ncbi:DNA topoisomerase I, partial [Candidatus Bathyarchaeota archaeon]|nr:DNA topoisomerase I [Candidatus Bathyarchaeota archaeon]
SLIAYTILKYAIGANSLKIAERMKFSTLTTSDLIEAYQNRQSALDFSLIEAGQTRHELDWLFGINLTRALTLSLQHVKWNRNIISTGRVQGPALKLLVDREREIRSFVPLPYWIIQAKTQIDKKQYPLVYSIPKVFVQKQAKQIVSECKGKTGTVTDINIKKINLSPPYPFDLGTLQSEAFRVFHFTPKQTLNIAESLYLKALISYPRTSSQKLPKSLQIPQILKQIKIQEKYFALAQKILKLGPRNPQQGIKDDPAHPAIHPTGKPPLRLSSQETKLYDLIVKRFLSTMAEPAQKETIQADLSINIHIFFLKGVKTLFLGWTEIYYPYYTAADIYLPSLHIGDQLPIISISSPKTYTKPPPRYNPGTILRELERLNLGTKATRADIIDRLYQRKYVKEIPAKVSKIGLAVIDVLESYCQDILSSEMTRELENQMCQIQDKKSKRSKVIFNA